LKLKFSYFVVVSPAHDRTIRQNKQSGNIQKYNVGRLRVCALKAGVGVLVLGKPEPEVQKRLCGSNG
jgi:hypothetical protein